MPVRPSSASDRVELVERVGCRPGDPGDVARRVRSGAVRPAASSAASRASDSRGGQRDPDERAARRATQVSSAASCQQLARRQPVRAQSAARANRASRPLGASVEDRRRADRGGARARRPARIERVERDRPAGRRAAIASASVSDSSCERQRRRSLRPREDLEATAATITPRRPIDPTISLGRSNPAAFLTTLPPPLTRRPVPSMKRTPMTKSRTPPWRSALGPSAGGDDSAERGPGGRPAAGRTAGTAVLGQQPRRSRRTGVPAAR